MNYSQIIKNLSGFFQKVRIMLKEGEKIEWDVRSEIVLFYSMIGLKPVGVNRYFIMTAIHQRFSELVRKELSSKVIWDHLDSMYDMSALHESEIVPFPNEELDFELNEDFDDLLLEKYGVSVNRPGGNDNESSSSVPGLKTAKRTSISKLKQISTPTANSKDTFLTPQSIKAGKNTAGSRSESRSSSADSIGKSKDTPQSTKVSNKPKRASSPLSTRSSRSESTSSTPEPSGIKVEKTTNASGKKTPKPDPVSAKSKQETSETSSRKSKGEKELPTRKGRASTPLENSGKKGAKVEGRRSDMEKRTDTLKSKSSSHQDSPVTSGLRKSTKVDLSDKKKRAREDFSRKGPSPVKRRRI